MGSLGSDQQLPKKAMWLYPKVLGFNPSERWGHSACYSHGLLYVFGGCCGGLHFGDVLVLNLDTMAWTALATTGHGPGPRDSHSAAIMDHRMIVFGGTNGSKKVNDVHILDLGTKEWVRPECKGTPPSPRESHTATLVGEEKLVVFGGSGEGEANYLNDLHILDLKTMTWTSPEVKGDMPLPRDSHSTVAIRNKLFVYGGDCGDRYHGDVDLLDLETFTWSKLAVQGLSPGVRAGHASVNLGRKVYVLGGVGDKHYYNDVWVLDVGSCLWTQIGIRGQQPQGRFSHTAVVAEADIAIYGGCGEDERPLNELLILQLGAEHPNGRYNISLCKILGNHLNQERRRFPRETENSSKSIFFASKRDVTRKETRDTESESKRIVRSSSDTPHSKRRRTANTKVWEIESEQEEHSLSLSQHSSPSQSDQEQTPNGKSNDSVIASHGFPFLKRKNHLHDNSPPENIVNNQVDPRNLHICEEHRNQLKPELFLPTDPTTNQILVGAEVRGKVDGAFDSGYLMTATVNGKIFRGVLFTPGPGVFSRSPIVAQNPSPLPSPVTIAQPRPVSNETGHRFFRPVAFGTPSSGHSHRHPQTVRPSSIIRTNPSYTREPKVRSDLQGVVLTLGGPTSGHGLS